ncbi:cystathionine beta-lyase [Seinonella peptonophila]|uniref:cysteine-S-conjugate beta-lyase n=1 Tax=Seinonella peptonophila TaxID=112248 RepID=A0A1M4VG69_9BACL|nr:aminotransferase class I/II-fold pyridoxal phosphate-dependent enzyme [Seinonella peptonophila]SHE67795.1 cystathionine beta-lyase [Seinonella peptonophila]
MHFETKVLHTGNEIDPNTGAASVPIYQASTFHQFSIDQPGPYDYARSGNPTRHALEQAIATLEEGTHGFAFASGMAAISTVLFLFSQGDHLLVSQDVYGGTYRVLSEVLPRLGITTDFVDTADVEKVKAAIQHRTRGLLIETPSNPLLKVSPLPELIDLAKQHQILTIVDNTFLTPYLQRPLSLDADIVVHSATKFIAGHSDVVAGLVVTANEELGERIGFLQNALGSILGVQDCWLVMRGLKTLQTRLKVSSETAGKLAEWLSQQREVKSVYYTGLSSHPGHQQQLRQADGHGAVLSFDLGSGNRVRELLSRVRLPIVAVSLGAVESILSYPALMSHAAMPAEVREQHGITDGLLRLSVGLEHFEDLRDDLKQAMEVSNTIQVGQ